MIKRFINWLSRKRKKAPKKRLPKQEPKERLYRTRGSTDFQTLLVTRPGMRILNQHPKIKGILQAVFHAFAEKEDITYFDSGEISVQPIHSRNDPYKGNSARKKLEITIGNKKLFCKLENSYGTQYARDAEKVATFLKARPEWNGIKIEAAQQFTAFNRGINTMYVTDFYGPEFVQGKALGEEDKAKCGIAIEEFNSALKRKIGRNLWDLDEKNYFYNAKENKIIIFDIDIR